MGLQKHRSKCKHAKSDICHAFVAITAGQKPASVFFPFKFRKGFRGEKGSLCWLQFAFWDSPFPCSLPLAVLLSKQLKSQRNVFPALFGPLHRGEEPFSFCKRDEKCQKLLVQIAHHLISCAHLLHDVRMIFLHFHRTGQRGCNDEHLRELFQLRTERCQFSEVKRDRTVWTGGFANHVLKKKKKSASKNGSKQARTKNAVRENGEIRF